MAIFAWICAYGIAAPQDVALLRPSASMPEELRARLEAIAHSPKITVRGEAIGARDGLARFYERRAFRPVWVCDDGLPPHVGALVQVIRDAEREGIRAVGYHLSKIDQLVVELSQNGAPVLLQSPVPWVDLELLLSDAFFMYGSHVLTGQIDPRALKEMWFAERPRVDLETALHDASQTNRVTELLHNLRPRHGGYAGLQKALASYRGIFANGGWPVIPAGPKLQKGDRGPRVMAVRHRLLATADLEQAADSEQATDPVDEIFDAALERGVQRFQERHGLEADGVVGASTLTALNVPAEDRVRQIELNMERWRWLPQTLAERYILVNIANFTLDIVEHGQSVLAMKVVVGKPARRTPVFSADMTYMVLSPHWYVPASIAIQDKLPLIRRDPSYVARQKFKLFRNREDGVARVDPLSVDWSSVSARNFPYRLRQDPGPRNALGRVKFMFPNPYHVYLHDTPARELFAKAERAFSSGCIRLERPIELAEYLLRDDSGWSQQRILAAIEQGTEQIVHLPTSIPVHLLYWTAWTSDDGVVHFRQDLYASNKALDRALRLALPSSKGENKVAVALRHR
jgi:murein L,D-transpeptidase YcbB/YkuD